MIKKYNEYTKESLLDKIEGPSFDDIIHSDINPLKLYILSLEENNEDGKEYALKQGVNKIINKLDEIFNNIEYKKGMYYDCYGNIKNDRILFFKYNPNTKYLIINIQLIMLINKLFENNDSNDILILILEYVSKEFDLEVEYGEYF